ncbi:hypothetical protein ACU61A_15595 [Pseudonocardia sichuanensis]
MMGWVFKTREDGMAANSDAAAKSWRAAAEAKRNGDTRAMREHATNAAEFDRCANAFADGRNDDVVRDRQKGGRS